MQNPAAYFSAILKQAADPQRIIHTGRDLGRSFSSSVSSRQGQHQIQTMLPKALFSHVLETSENRDPRASWVAWSLV